MARQGTGGLNAAAAELREEQWFADMLFRRKREIAAVIILVLLVLGGYWFQARSKALKEQHAEAAYLEAMQSLAAGNVPLAQADLKRMATRYAGSNGGSEGAMALAKLYYQQGNWQAGISVVAPVAKRGGDMQYDARILMGVGYEGANQVAEAARTYESAAAVARFPEDAASARAMAARAYQMAGDRANAVRLWTELSKDPSGAYTPEAKVRLGQLEAQVQKT